MIDYIPDTMTDDVRRQLAEVATIVGEYISPRTIRFNLGPKSGIASKRRLDAEAAIIRQYCNAPYSCYVDDGLYHFALSCN